MKRFTVLLVLFVFAGMVLHAQGVQITGNVTSAEDGSALPGVSVVVKGTTVGTVTDITGDYSVSVPSNATTLVFSFVGMRTEIVAIEGKNVINVSMKSEATGLDEVVVTAFGISKQKKALGYAATDVTPDETLNKSEPDLMRSLQGVVPGLDIRSTGGAPGSAAQVTIRGATSFSGSNEPLFIVDGMPYSNDQYVTQNLSDGGGAYGSGISTLDPNDIKSMTVLKGSAAAAIYGSRAKNGVIVITTKSGSSSATKKGFEVSLNSSVNFEQISSLPEYQNTYGAGHDFGAFNDNGSWGARFDKVDSILTWPGYSAAFGWGDSIAYKAQPNNVKDLFQTGVVYENSMNVQGGNEKSSFNLTVSNLNNSGYIPYSSFKRTNISIGGATELENKLKFSGNVSYSTSEQIGGLFGNNQSSDGYAASSFARSLWLARNWIIDPYENPATGEPIQPNGVQFDNPLWSYRHNQITTDLNRVVGNLGVSYDLTSWLNLAYRVGVNTLFQNRKEVIDIGSRAAVYGGQGGITTDDVVATEINSQFLLNFNKQLGDLSISGFAGQEINQRVSNRQAYRGFGFVNKDIYDIDNTNLVIPFGGNYYKQRLMGLFADATFGYKDLIYLDLTDRVDFSSTLPFENHGNRYFYPSASLSFLFADALGLKSDIFNYGKIRASWGKTGMDADPYSIKDIYALRSGTFPFLEQPSMYTPNTTFNPALQPEMKQDIEFGTNLAFFQNRLNVDLTYYNSTSTNMIYPVYVAPSSGFTLNYTNVGKMVNNGIEASIGVTPVRMASGLNWDIRFNYTMNRNTVEDINGKDSLSYVSQLFGDPAIAIKIGEAYGSFYGNMAARDANGNFLIDKGSGLIIQRNEQGIYGSPDPDYTLSMNNQLSIKGFSLSFMIDYRHGGDVFSNSVVTMLGRGVTKDTEDREKSVIIPGVYGDANTGKPLLDGNDNEIPNETQVSVNDLYFCSGTTSSFAINSFGEFQVYDGTMIRLRDVTLGYNLPDKLFEKIPLGGITISFSGRNLWFLAPNLPKYTHFDPETSTYGAGNIRGVEYSGAPSTRRYGVNLKVTF